MARGALFPEGELFECECALRVSALLSVRVDECALLSVREFRVREFRVSVFSPTGCGQPPAVGQRG